VTAKNKPTASKAHNKTGDKKIVIGGDVVGHDIIIGNNNVVKKTTFIQKIFNIFKSDAETLEHRNRRILLNHVENAWIKGVLDASLHGAALLDLGIKQDPEAVTQYPWAIKKESTDETLPAGTSMLEIFDSIGMGRSLLILGAPGSGKTTMLLELARQLIARAREDVTQPIPMVFNFASWTEKLTLADWLAQELNNLYSVPRKTAPDWVKGNKLLLLLDGLDEVRQESRAKCVEAINEFRKEHGLTSLAVCSRSQDYADLNAKLSFEGAIGVQPLTQGQITEFINHFGKEMAGIKQVLKKDSALREMAETPLFLSIMIMAYRDKQDVEILISGDEKARRKHLFDAYIERMFERQRLNNIGKNKLDVLRWLSWLAGRMQDRNETLLSMGNINFQWLDKKDQSLSAFADKYLIALVIITNLGIIAATLLGLSKGLRFNWSVWLVGGLFAGLIIGFSLGWSLSIGIGFQSIKSGFETDLKEKDDDKKIIQMLLLTILVWAVFTLVYKLNIKSVDGMSGGLIWGLVFGGALGLILGSSITILYLTLYYEVLFLIVYRGYLPFRLVPFLDHCVDLIFLRRVGGGYIFVHRLLMEHFAEMYVETPTSKGN
jgi:hypothetical protein